LGRRVSPVPAQASTFDSVAASVIRTDLTEYC
jgi:hypothetical protein